MLSSTIQSHGTQIFHATASKPNRKGIYLEYDIIFPFDDLPTCTCPAYIIARNRAFGPGAAQYGKAMCKHILRFWDQVCRWKGTPIVPNHCPECGGHIQ